MSGRADRDAGRVSVFLAISMLAIFMIIAVSYDGTRRLMAMQRAHNLAAEAARTGGQAIDLGAAIDGGPKRLDVNAAIAAVNGYRAAAGVTGPTPVIEGDPPNQTITVTVQFTYQPILLSAFGMGAVPIEGTATARPLTEEP
ncbi:hypothetical protein OG792_31940 [Micromonospora sp. NBC_01699]|uniref:hypothetical protein n=1 Tax=Micromonospora sp. NBC_01699 TaxID=2975984 RepID=UPI002E283FAA|nr:hypothetical protein [Micromonospora sp. NBC_01699]